MKKLIGTAILAGLLMSASAAFAANVQVDLKPFFNNDGIMALGAPDDEEGLDKVSDGAWASFDAAYFPVGGGLVTATLDKDVKFMLPNPAAGLKNNIEANGQEIPVSPDLYKALYVLGTSHHGATDTAVLLKYEDGTSREEAVSFSDWCGAPGFDGEVPVFSMDHRVALGSGDSQALNCYISAFTVKVNPDKKLKSIVLPAVTDDFPADHLHVFGLTLDTK